MDYSLIIPIFNEKKTLPGLLNQINSIKDRMEIILIDDGSNDGSNEILKNFNKNNEIIILKNKSNLGKGHSIRKGLKLASGNNIILADGDLEIDITIIPTIIKSYGDNFIKHNHNSVLVGVREGLNNQKNYTVFNLGNKYVNLIFNFIYGTNFQDILCCLKIINREKMIDFNLASEGFDIETEIMAQIAKREMSTIEYVIGYKSRSLKDGKKIKLIDSFLIFKRMIKAKLIRLPK